MKYEFNGETYGLPTISIICETARTEQNKRGIRYFDSVTLKSDGGEYITEYTHGATWNQYESNGDFLTESGWEPDDQKAELTSVISSFVSDATAAGYDFPDFAETYGFTEPRKAWEAWTACKKAREGFKRVFGLDVDSNDAQPLVTALYDYDNGDRPYLDGITIDD